ncbi:hypothetical protein PEC302107_34010 [Pectobacterium araliae]|uniref:DUF6966 domain-containing protein n=1 Tax=Pectobacterium araliae TaxID=3073862 RepID=A0AAN0KAQ9_9GAMM|nr:hypothetical protein PEC302110_21530 [Pectobacterium sp. MAFF 302110]GKW21672.1 hypothetical protein PEC302107_34010 [Pectobacterium carotovorum subsp. carotovorum]
MNQDRLLAIQSKLKRMALLLNIGGYPDWANGLVELSNRVVVSPDAARTDLLGLYGGMGSLNDLLLYKDGVLLFDENEELDRLRTEVFDLASYA